MIEGIMVFIGYKEGCGGLRAEGEDSG